MPSLERLFVAGVATGLLGTLARFAWLLARDHRAGRQHNPATARLERFARNKYRRFTRPETRSPR